MHTKASVKFGLFCFLVCKKRKKEKKEKKSKPKTGRTRQTPRDTTASFVLLAGRQGDMGSQPAMATQMKWPKPPKE
jgi:hypothetical protein